MSAKKQVDRAPASAQDIGDLFSGCLVAADHRRCARHDLDLGRLVALAWGHREGRLAPVGFDLGKEPLEWRLDLFEVDINFPAIRAARNGGRWSNDARGQNHPAAADGDVEAVTESFVELVGVSLRLFVGDFRGHVLQWKCDSGVLFDNRSDQRCQCVEVGLGAWRRWFDDEL